MRAMLRAGADKVSVNSAAVNNPDLINAGAERFGSQCVVLSVDVKRRQSGTGWEVYLNGGRLNTEMDALEWLIEGEKRGPGSSCSTAWTPTAPRAATTWILISSVAEKTNLPIVASRWCRWPRRHGLRRKGRGRGRTSREHIPLRRMEH